MHVPYGPRATPLFIPQVPHGLLFTPTVETCANVVPF